MLWLRYQAGELQRHVVEDSRPGHDNPRIVKYHSFTAGGESPDEVPWCSSFECFGFEMAGFVSPRSKRARSWLEWSHGVELFLPAFGCVAIFARGAPGSGQGHVGTVVGWTDTQLAILGGNQHDSVSVAWFDRDRLLGFRWPKGVALENWMTAPLTELLDV